LVLGEFEGAVLVLPEFPLGAGHLETSTLLHLHRNISSDDGAGLVALPDDTSVTHRFDLAFGEIT
jgi:hypothetical protein